MKKRILALIVSVAVIGNLCTGMVAFADGEDDETTSVFFNDFEEYDSEKVFVPVYESNGSNNAVYFVREYSGNAGMTNPTLKKGETHPFYNDKLATPLSGDLYPRPAGYFSKNGSGSYTYQYIDRSKYAYGGLPGYVGFDSLNTYPLWYGESGRSVAANVDNLTVVKNEKTGNQELILNPMELTGRTYSGYAAFGKEQLNLLGRKNLIELDVRIDNEENADAFRLSIAKNTNYNNYTSWKNYDWMNYNAQFYNNKGSSWVDVVTFMDGKVYLGDMGTISNIKPESFVCNYAVGKYYSIKYYLNLDDISNPMHMVYIYDDAGNLAGKKSAPLVLTETTTSTINSDAFYEGAVEGATNSTNRGPAVNTYFKSFDESSTYSVIATYATAVDIQGKLDARAAIDNFGLSESEITGFELTTDMNKYLDNPIPFYGEQTAEIEFNVDLLSNISDGHITVKDADGKDVNCTIDIVNGNKVKFTFPDGLSATSNYYVNCSKDLKSAMGTLGTDIVFTIRTADNLNINNCTLSGNTLSTSISNNSADDLLMVIVAAVKSGTDLVGNKLYYKSFKTQSNETKTVTISDIVIPSGAEVEVFYIDGFGTLKAFSDKLIAD